MLMPSLFLLLALIAPSRQVLQSPCPDVLEYAEISQDELPRWYGKIHLPRRGHWLFMTIVLDRKANLLGNWYGDVTTQDNMEYKIDNPDFWTKKEPMRIFVSFDAEDPPPKVQLIALDGREICFDDGSDQTTEAVPAPVPVIESHTARSVPSTEINRITTTQSPNVGMPIALSSFKQECGRVLYKSSNSLVVQGTEEGQWPWQVAIYKVEGVDNNYICGGTLVSHRHVITAAHCSTIRGRRPIRKVVPASLTVFLGKHNLKTSVKGVQIRLVSKIAVYPDYDSVSLISRDLSVLEMNSPVQYTDWVQPACLWPDELSDLKHVIGKNGSVVGWGSDMSGELLLVEMPVVSQEACLRIEGSLFYLTVTSDYTYCAGLRNGSSPCNGDSGGGMVFKIDGFWYLRGLVSVAPSKPNDNVCDPVLYAVFTDLAKFLPWIRENIEPY